MPYKKRYKRRRRYGRRSSKGVYLARKALAMCRLDIEVQDDLFSASTVGTSPLTLSPMILSQGLTGESRAGNFASMTRTMISGIWYWNNAAANNECRVLLVKDIGALGALPGIGDIFTDTTTSVMVSHRNLEHTKTIKILYDRKFLLDEYYRMKYFKASIRIKKPVQTKYSGNAGTVADVQENNYIWLFVSQNATNSPTIKAAIRTYYYR